MKKTSFFFRVINKLLNLSVDFLSDSLFLKLKFYIRFGRKLDLKNPKSYNEKLQWLKLNDKHPEYTQLVDKIEVKKYVKNTIGEKYIIPTIGVWDKVEEIEWDKLPNRFVIKVTNDSGGVVVCKDKRFLDIEAAKIKLLKGYGINYYKYNKEYPYKNVKPRIIAEEYMEDESGFELKDYKIFCSYGVPKFLFVATGRQKHDTRFDFFDINFNHISVINGHPNADITPVKPKNYETMLDISSKLSKDIPQVRVDLYNCDGKIYFGELTFFHWSGMTPFEPEEYDFKFGDLITLPKL